MLLSPQFWLVAILFPNSFFDTNKCAAAPQNDSVYLQFIVKCSTLSNLTPLGHRLLLRLCLLSEMRLRGSYCSVLSKAMPSSAGISFTLTGTGVGFPLTKRWSLNDTRYSLLLTFKKGSFQQLPQCPSIGNLIHFIECALEKNEEIDAGQPLRLTH